MKVTNIHNLNVAHSKEVQKVQVNSSCITIKTENSDKTDAMHPFTTLLSIAVALRQVSANFHSHFSYVKNNTRKSLCHFTVAQ